MLIAPFGRGAWKLNALLVFVLFIGGASYAANKKASVVVATVEIPGQGSIIIADPQVSTTGFPDHYGRLSFLILNHTPHRLQGGRLVLRQYVDDKRMVQAPENLTVDIYGDGPGSLGELARPPLRSASGLLRWKVKAFDVLAAEIRFEERNPQASVLDPPQTFRFTHEFQKGEAKAIVAKAFGRAKVE